MPSQDYYGTLGVSRNAKSEEIRKAYRRLARKHHPDLNPGEKAAEDRFKKIQEAYDVLSDPKKKQMYDQHGFYSANASAPGGEGARQGPEMGFGGFDFSDILSQAAAGRSRRRKRSPGAAFATCSARCSDAERSRGLRRSLSRAPTSSTPSKSTSGSPSGAPRCRYPSRAWSAATTCGGSGRQGGANSVCPECNGTGNVTQMAGAMKFSLTCPRCGGQGRLRNECATCHGDGRLPRIETVEARIPQGVQPGARLRLPGKGNSGTGGAPAGDLYITVRVAPHPFFQRDGDNILIQVPVTVDEASLGAKIEVPTIDGRALFKIPMGTQNGQKFRLREKGVLNTRKGTRADQIVEVAVQAIKVRDERTKELLRELASLNPEDPRAEMWPKV